MYSPLLSVVRIVVVSPTLTSTYASGIALPVSSVSLPVMVILSPILAVCGVAFAVSCDFIAWVVMFSNGVPSSGFPPVGMVSLSTPVLSA